MTKTRTNQQGIADPPVPDEQTMSGNLAGSTSVASAPYDFALAQLLDGSPTRPTADAAPVSRQKSGRMPDQSLRIDAIIGTGVGNPPAGTQPTPTRTASQPADTALEEVLAEWDSDGTLAIQLP